MTDTLKKVLLVGHCSADSGSLTYLVEKAMGISAQRVNSDDTLARQAGPDTLLLVNRVLDGSFNADDGVALIAQLAEGKNPPAMMLVSNYADAQAKASAAGALPGFGKDDIGDGALTKRLAGMVKGK